MHLLIFGVRSGKTACGVRVHCFYPSSEQAVVDGIDEPIACTAQPFV
jgi:hypothetical protein